MRTRLLEATVQCLVTYGYSGTTTHKVSEVAGVTRGAQLHHFPSREALVVAALEYLTEQRVAAAIRDLGRVQDTPDPIAQALDYLWESHQGPIFVATVELWIAARTDPVLTEQVQRLEPIVNGALIGAIAQMMPEHAAQKELRDLVYTAMDALRGILISGLADEDPRRSRKRWNRVCAHLRTMLGGALP